MIYSKNLLAMMLVLSVALSACGDKKTAAASAAVKVNGEAISVEELQSKMRQHSQIRDGQELSVPAAVIKSQIDMELLRQAAVKEGMATDAAIHARLAESARFILATAYLDKQVAAVAKPGEAEVKAYFNQHPERYAERKQFELQEVRIQTQPDNVAQIKEKLGSGKTFKAFLGWLKDKKIPNNSQQLVTTSDQMNEDVLKKLNSIKTGEAIVIEGKDQLNVVFINAVKFQPATIEQATPMIMKTLDDTRKRDSMNEKLKQLREKAKIEYVAPYTENGMLVSGNQ